jgi:hypothetical protein
MSGSGAGYQPSVPENGIEGKNPPTGGSIVAGPKRESIDVFIHTIKPDDADMSLRFSITADEERVGELEISGVVSNLMNRTLKKNTYRVKAKVIKAVADMLRELVVEVTE